jgi:hypothetical protein
LGVSQMQHPSGDTDDGEGEKNMVLALSDILRGEAQHLRYWGKTPRADVSQQSGEFPAFFVQQVHNRAVAMGHQRLAERAAKLIAR